MAYTKTTWLEPTGAGREVRGVGGGFEYCKSSEIGEGFLGGDDDDDFDGGLGGDNDNVVAQPIREPIRRLAHR